MDPLNTIITEIVPEYYITQVYQQLETCNLEECDFFQIKAYSFKSNQKHMKIILYFK